MLLWWFKALRQAAAARARASSPHLVRHAPVLVDAARIEHSKLRVQNAVQLWVHGLSAAGGQGGGRGRRVLPHLHARTGPRELRPAAAEEAACQSGSGGHSAARSWHHCYSPPLLPAAAAAAATTAASQPPLARPQGHLEPRGQGVQHGFGPALSRRTARVACRCGSSRLCGAALLVRGGDLGHRAVCIRACTWACPGSAAGSGSRSMQQGLPQGSGKGRTWQMAVSSNTADGWDAGPPWSTHAGVGTGAEQPCAPLALAPAMYCQHLCTHACMHVHTHAHAHAP